MFPPVKSANLHYKLAESCFSEELLRFPVKSANLRNLRIETVHCFGCGPQAALCNLRINYPREVLRALGLKNLG
jgi:hypothetical protein